MSDRREYWCVYQGRKGRTRLLGCYSTEAEAKRIATSLRSAARERHDPAGRTYVLHSYGKPS